MIKIVNMEAIRNAPPIPHEELETATPQRIDERNARLDAELRTTLGVIRSAIDTAHDVAGDRAQGRGRPKRWGMSDEDAERIMREQVAAGTVSLSYRHGAADTLQRLDAARAHADRIERETARLEAEFTRRGGWSRFITVPGGHIHSGRWCAGGSIRPSTVIGWTPRLSGMSEAAALAHLAEMGHVLCTLCFPNAPVAEKAVTVHCEGKGKPYMKGTYRYSYPNGTGECPDCHTRQSLTPNRYVRAHKPPPETPPEPGPAHPTGQASETETS